MMTPPDPFDDFAFPYGEDDDDLEAEMNCGLGPDGLCSLAGSEHCEFDCPFGD